MKLSLAGQVKSVVAPAIANPGGRGPTPELT